jgi:hypothetical protein
MSHQQLSNIDFNNAAKPINVPQASATGELVTYEQMNALIHGTSWKDSVRAASTGNINIASPGATIDSVAMASGDRALLKNQTDPLENGIWIWNGAAVAMTRATDADLFAELESAVVRVDPEAGASNAGTRWRQTAVNGVIGTDAITWVDDSSTAPSATETTSGVAELATQAETDTGTDDTRIVTPLKLKTWSLRVKGGSTNIGDGAATQYDVTHNFNTRAVQVEVYRNASPWDSIGCDVERPDANTVRLRFASAPTTNQFTVLISTVPTA